MPSKLNPEQVKEFVSSEWDNSIIPALKEYIKIPNLSPDFDPEVLTNGYQDKAIDLMVNWVNEQNVHGLKLEVLREAHRTPIIFIEVESTTASSVKSGTVLMYGHMDKVCTCTYTDTHTHTKKLKHRYYSQFFAFETLISNHHSLDGMRDLIPISQ